MARVYLLALVLGYLAIQCAAQCVNPAICTPPQACCADKLHGDQCYVPGVSHDCVASTTGGFLLCPPGQRACANQCYSTLVYQCVSNILVPITPAPGVCPSGFQCSTGQLCCVDKFHGEQCYDPATLQCVSSSLGGFLLCPRNNQICNDKLHGEQCFNPGVSHDCVASTTGGFLLCPPGQKACANQCYSPLAQQCVGNILVPIASPTPVPPACPPSFTCNTAAGEACCPDNLNGPGCYRPGITHDCVSTTTGGFLLCPPGQKGCGIFCYDTTRYSCSGSTLVPL